MDLTTRVQIILNEHPQLHVWGVGRSRRGRQYVEIPADREELLDPAYLHQIQTAAYWCQLHLEASKPARSDRDTYYWKHRFERDTGGLYLPSGAFAVAAALAGLPLNWDSFNAVVHARESRHNPIEVRPRASLRTTPKPRKLACCSSGQGRPLPGHLSKYPLCTSERCAAIPESRRPASTHMHYIDGTGHTGKRAYDPSNLQALCHSCYSRKTVNSDGRFGRAPVQQIPQGS